MNACGERAGSMAGYRAHRKADEDACDPCLAANRDYLAEYRRLHPERLGPDKDQVKARQRALARLGRRHPEQYKELLLEELARIREERAS